MTWQVEASEDVEAFLNGLSDDEIAEVAAKLKLLMEFGPRLGRPHVDTLHGSRHSNLKELRIPFQRKQFRVLFAFDTQRKAILLTAGDKVPLGDRLWYPKFISIADAALDQHEKNLKAEQNARNVKPKSR